VPPASILVIVDTYEGTQASIAVLSGLVAGTLSRGEHRRRRADGGASDRGGRPGRARARERGTLADRRRHPAARPGALAARVVVVDDRERAWGAVHDAIAHMPGWAVGPCTYHGDGALWHVTAIDLRPRSRYAKREAIEATGETEIAALRALVALLEARQMGGR
jgi:hypothetical protein